MKLGIPYNKWHLILAIIAVALSFFLLWYFLSNLLIPGLGTILTGIILYFLSVQIAHHLQCWNEINQALDPQVEEKYGGNYKLFQNDSRNDFSWFWRGILVSWIIPLVIMLI
jgi:hypothetical protein